MRVQTKLTLKNQQKMFQKKEIRLQQEAGPPSTASIRSMTASSKESIITPKQFQSGKQN
jgi:hypothetical protein